MSSSPISRLVQPAHVRGINPPGLSSFSLWVPEGPPAPAWGRGTRCPWPDSRRSRRHHRPAVPRTANLRQPGTGIATGRKASARIAWQPLPAPLTKRSEEHTSELQSLMRISYAVFCLKKKTKLTKLNNTNTLRIDQVNKIHKNITYHELHNT